MCIYIYIYIPFLINDQQVRDMFLEMIKQRKQYIVLICHRHKKRLHVLRNANKNKYKTTMVRLWYKWIGLFASMVKITFDQK